ncbi:redoxin domain-containing protein [Halosimplex litoreum]|uniref:Redoxin domain-containing protein n=1 Tax=Halosimplex litoreum TaxID=1198301 RepID=A0A7T3FW91_9EURY|nr:redoxin domain-containing protein [Halosimplex litoreum]QPV61836.1 redoxin domain-containing protein [Halosimplex litoreum]
MSARKPAPAFELPNVGPGPDPCSLATLAANESFVVLLFHHDDECHDCRAQAKKAGDRYAALRARDAVAVSVLPTGREVAEDWQDRFDLPHPLLVDPDGTAGADYDQPVRLPMFAELPIFGRLPAVVVVDTRGAEPEIAWTYRGRSTWDHPSMTTVLEGLDSVRE